MDMDLAYANADFIAGASEFPPRWAAEAAAFRERLGTRAVLDLPYGPGGRQAFDLFLPDGAVRGCVVFIHGGYWLRFGRKDWSHFAAGSLARGWACAMPSYTLAPEARISAITAEMVAAVRAIGERVAGPLVVTGHSAGGHLSARMGCADQDLPRVVRVVPISPVAELAPLRLTKMQENLRIDDAEEVGESPARLARRSGVSAHVWVGGAERPSFLWQARLLSENWGCDWTVDPGKHHFDVIDGLKEAHSPLMECLFGGV